MAVNYLDVLTIICKMTQAGQQIRNVYEVIHTGTITLDNLPVLNAALAWAESIYAPLFGSMTNQLSFDTVQVNNKTQGTIIGEAAFPTLTAGGDADTASPLQISAVVRFPTGFKGSQGRKFIPGLCEDDLEANGILSAAWQSALATTAANALNGFTVSGNLFVYGADNPGLGRFAAFQSGIVNDVVGTQRRRKQGVGI